MIIDGILTNIECRLSHMLWVILLGIGLYAFPVMGAGQPKKILHMEIKAEIDTRMQRYVTLALAEADRLVVDAVIIEMDTYGGAVAEADAIRASLLAYQKPIYVFINKNAISAGALISIACDSIYMTPGASIGAATVVTPDGQAAPDKYQSFMRAMMRSTAEAKGRNAKIAEAMVDENIEIADTTKAKQVITFTTREAIQYKFCEAQVHTIDDILKRNDLQNHERISFRLGITEKIIAFFLNPFVSGLLILVIVGGLYFELQTPGVGFSLLAAVMATLLYFTPHYLHGLVGHLEIILFILGLGLLLLELFIIPGFGIAGIIGIICMVGGLAMGMLNNQGWDFTFVPSQDIMQAFTIVLTALAGAVILGFISGIYFTKSHFFQRMALQTVQDVRKGYTAQIQMPSLVGKQGVAYTKLRPSGKISIQDKIYDAHTQGNYIAKGAPVLVISNEGTSLIVKAV